jgi:hypothetical protein
MLEMEEMITDTLVIVQRWVILGERLYMLAGEELTQITAVLGISKYSVLGLDRLVPKKSNF